MAIDYNKALDGVNLYIEKLHKEIKCLQKALDIGTKGLAHISVAETDEWAKQTAKTYYDAIQDELKGQ